MRRLKRVAGALLAGFLLFAPPGTLIFGALLFIGLVRNVWVVAGVGLAAVGLLAFGLYRKGSARRSRL